MINYIMVENVLHSTISGDTTMPEDLVHIYVQGHRDPVCRLSRLELASRSRLLHHLLTSLRVCDGCSQPLALIITGEEARTVEAAFKQVEAPFNKTVGVSIIQGEIDPIICPQIGSHKRSKYLSFQIQRKLQSFSKD